MTKEGIIIILYRSKIERGLHVLQHCEDQNTRPQTINFLQVVKHGFRGYVNVREECHRWALGNHECIQATTCRRMDQVRNVFP